MGNVIDLVAVRRRQDDDLRARLRATMARGDEGHRLWTEAMAAGEYDLMEHYGHMLATIAGEIEDLGVDVHKVSEMSAEGLDAVADIRALLRSPGDHRVIGSLSPADAERWLAGTSLADIKRDV